MPRRTLVSTDENMPLKFGHENIVQERKKEELRRKNDKSQEREFD
jgi:hypothetical protein